MIDVNRTSFLRHVSTGYPQLGPFSQGCYKNTETLVLFFPFSIFSSSLFFLLNVSFALNGIINNLKGWALGLNKRKYCLNLSQLSFFKMAHHCLLKIIRDMKVGYCSMQIFIRGF